jgi:NADH-quinone oxidoreductase subunit M
MTQIVLSSVIFLPLVGAILILLLSGNSQDKRIAERIRLFALSVTIATFIISLNLLLNFQKGNFGFQFEEKFLWIKAFNIFYHVGVDGLSLSMIVLTTLLTPICLLAGWESIKKQVTSYVVSFLLLEFAVIGAFAALDLALFYVFFEAMLIPMFIIIGIWGGENRIYAAYKFFLYTMAGSIFLLVAIIYIYSSVGSFDIMTLSQELPKVDIAAQKWLWLGFFISFAVKVPMWPVHTWLPDAHVQAPTAGSVILAGILLKLGAYGFLRFSLPMLPAASEYFAPFVFMLSYIAVIYASLVALVQKDMKKLIAYSSIAHMGYVTIGIFTFNLHGIEGAVVQMISHGLVSGALFLCVGVLYDRMHTKEINAYGGVVETMPKFAVIFLLFVMASIGLPGTSGFIGEFLVLAGIYKVNKIVTMLAATGLVLGAAYMLWLYKRVVFGTITNNEVAHLTDVSKREILMFAPLIILVLLIGIYPKIITDFIRPSVLNAVKPYSVIR